MAQITIHTTPTSYRVRTTPSLHLPHTTLNLYRHISPFSELKWDNQARRMVVKRRYVYRDEDTGMLFMPRYDLPRFTALLEKQDISYVTREVPLCHGKAVDIPIQSWYKPRDKTQEDALESILHGVKQMRGLSLQPGTGKTALSLVSSAMMGRRFLIKTPILLKQWEKSIHKFLDLDPDDVYIVSGSASLARLISEIDQTIFPKVILAATQTLNLYANREPPYHIFPRMEEFLDILDVGIVISDEVHMFFHMNLILDMLLNPSIMIPMSATFEVTDKQIEPIFNGHFPPSIRFGEDRYERYVIVSSYTFDIPMNKIPKTQYRTFMGYNHTLYEKDLLKKRMVLDKIIDDVYYPILEMEYFQYAIEGERLLIICARKEMCTYLLKRIRKDYPDKKSAVFFGKTDESVKSENDIIIATVKSAGVGFDVENLITTFVTVAADSPPLNKQMLGRLRKVKNRNPRLAYVSCRTIESHRNYTMTRRRIFPSLAKEFSQHHLG